MIRPKLMYAVWGSDLAGPLQDPSLHERLAQAGVRRLQVNLDDADVAPAMRIPTGEPIGAIVSVWDADDEAVTPILAEVARAAGGTMAGWEVEERLPKAPPETAPGERLDALVNIAVLKRPDELPVEEWRHRWLVDHTPIALATQATSAYIQNVVVAPVTPDPPRVVDALVEEHFPSAGMSDVHAFYGSGGDDAELNDRITRLMTSVARIGFDHDIDLVPTSRYLYAPAG